MNREQRRLSERMQGRRQAQRRARRPERRPMMKPLKDRISLDMHLALARLRTAPDDDARTDLAATLNTVQVAIHGDPRFTEEAAVLHDVGATLNDYRAGEQLTDDQLAMLAHGAAVIDTILGLIDVDTLFAAERTAVALMRAARSNSAVQPA